MEETSIGKITEHFEKVLDPRAGNATRHKLIDIIVIAICAVICGANGWSDVALFGKSKYSWLKTFLELPHGIPSHDTFGRVFGLIDPREFQHAEAGKKQPKAVSRQALASRLGRSLPAQGLVGLKCDYPTH
jgi:hypothetical protein